MQRKDTTFIMAATVAVSIALITVSVAAVSPGDFDDSGYVNLTDLATFWDCFDGPDVAYLSGCDVTDFDDDNDVDILDFATMQTTYGHTPIPLKDRSGGVLTPGATAPYSPRQTCGGLACHDVDEFFQIANSYHFQQGRTDISGNIIMQDDFFGDGRTFQRSPGMYGKWWAFEGAIKVAGKVNANASEFDNTAYNFVSECGGCHPGGGSGEFDRDGRLLYNEDTGLFGWDVEGIDPSLDGDYQVLDFSTGLLSDAPWDVTGLSQPDCLMCHRWDRTITEGQDMNRIWREAVLRGGASLVDDQAATVPAFTAAATAGQGWYSTLELAPEGPLKATILQIDYSVGLADGSLIEADGVLNFSPASMARPKDYSCWACHESPEQTKRGRVWFDTRDVHYAKFTNQGTDDEDPANDIAPTQSQVCIVCHVGDLDHNLTKGNAFQELVHNETDYVGFRSCRDCHDTNSPVRHPDAPETPGQVAVHISGPMYESLSCQACHIPYRLDQALHVDDNAVTGSTITYQTDEFLSADPLNPSDPDKSTWYPALKEKIDSDGVTRFFPTKIMLTIWWGDWDQNGTPGDLDDDVISPIALWRVRQITGDAPLPVVTDDNGDEKPEVNRPEEILAYLQALQGNDSNGIQVAANPVLVKAGRIWYEDAGEPEGVNSFVHGETDIAIESLDPFSIDHNVLAKEESWGAGDPAACGDCHDPDSPVFDRLILVDPWDIDGQPVYQTVREMTGLEPNP